MFSYAVHSVQFIFFDQASHFVGQQVLFFKVLSCAQNSIFPATWNDVGIVITKNFVLKVFISFHREKNLRVNLYNNLLKKIEIYGLRLFLIRAEKQPFASSKNNYQVKNVSFSLSYYKNIRLFFVPFP